MSASVFFTELVLRIIWDKIFESVLLTIKVNKVDFLSAINIILFLYTYSIMEKDFQIKYILHFNWYRDI